MMHMNFRTKMTIVPIGKHEDLLKGGVAGPKKARPVELHGESNDANPSLRRK